MKTLQPAELSTFHTFSIPTQAHHLVVLDSANELKSLRQQQPSCPMLIGQGSNLLFVETRKAPLMKFDFSAVCIKEHQNDYLIRAEAGKNWHEMVCELCERGIGGLENLALIPGTVGACPVQNIGAYGVDVSQICQSVEVFDWASGHSFELDFEQCEFAYRHSVFKTSKAESWVIVAVNFKLTKSWQPQIDYHGLAEQLDVTDPSPKDVMKAVVTVRQSKLPNPEVLGNAGSFFKNPTVSMQLAQHLKNQYPTMPQFQNQRGVKIPAAWLIDHRGWKGRAVGGASVHAKQALVIVNHGQAKASDVVQLAHDIQQDILTAFGILLTPEVRFVGQEKELTLEQAYAQSRV
ncbi:UDP-N-acetylmuramate dehydrogenase [Echinimonas agarilytica]|uniref:UDP-N-acetylenolpyruvoylglucosamine reductase n=1 Tax=Echinimonas agarilytica TaxID=1215918 RepID=A0AA41WC60_9GAMM|nr:UDP-N-acetylmuramate dehydrogenase [Echinimonas agarilytica]MCM2681456.1 UDP-N-acetylmuramate dehydrogenase [Echinimonas agarilytica]